MPSAIRVVHEISPRDEIMQDCKKLLKGVHPAGDRILIVVYERGKQKGRTDIRTTGGIIVPQGSATSTLGEDKWQGRVGLVMAMGPLAFTADADHTWGDVIPKIGDWVMFDVPNTSPFDLPGDRRARYVRDVHVEAVLDDDTFDAMW